jgi:hypothetical protein
VCSILFFLLLTRGFLFLLSFYPLRLPWQFDSLLLFFFFSFLLQNRTHEKRNKETGELEQQKNKISLREGPTKRDDVCLLNCILCFCVKRFIQLTGRQTVYIVAVNTTTTYHTLPTVYVKFIL